MNLPSNQEVPEELVSDIIHLLNQDTFYLLIDEKTDTVPEVILEDKQEGKITLAVFRTSLDCDLQILGDTDFFNGQHFTPKWEKKSFYELFTYTGGLFDLDRQKMFSSNITPFF